MVHIGKQFHALEDDERAIALILAAVTPPVTIGFVLFALGMAGDSVPTAKVGQQDISFLFYFPGGLPGSGSATMPAMLSTVTGEDLKSTCP